MRNCTNCGQEVSQHPVFVNTILTQQRTFTHCANCAPEAEARAQFQIEQRRMYTEYWLHYAASGAAGKRKVTDGAGNPIPPDQLTQEAFDTARRHIQLAEDFHETLMEIRYGKRDEPFKEDKDGKDN